MDEGFTQPLSSDPMINLNTTLFFFLILSPVCEESPQLGASRPYNWWSQRSTEVREGKQHTQIRSNTHAHKPRLELKMKHNEFTTRTKLKSLRQSIKCMETECGRLRMLRVCLGDSSICLGVPFIAPRQLGAVGDQQGRLRLPSVGWRTRQSGAPPDSHCSLSGADLLPFLVQTIVAPRRRLAHRTLSGAHFWPLVRATCRPPISLSTVAESTVGSPNSPVPHRTVRWILAVRRWTFPESDDFTANDSSDSLVHHRTVRWIIVVRRRRVPRVACSPDAGLAHRTLSGAPPNSPVHPDRAVIGCTQPTIFQLLFSCF
jgi:hypothetical protein